MHYISMITHSFPPHLHIYYSSNVHFFERNFPLRTEVTVYTAPRLTCLRGPLPHAT